LRGARGLDGDLCGDAPDFRTISEFRKRHLQGLARLFVQVLKLADKARLVKLGPGWHLNRANASKHKAMSYGRMKKREVESSRSGSAGRPGQGVDLAATGVALFDAALVTVRRGAAWQLQRAASIRNSIVASYHPMLLHTWDVGETFRIAHRHECTLVRNLGWLGEHIVVHRQRVPNIRSLRPRASGEYAGICSIPNCARARLTCVAPCPPAHRPRRGEEIMAAAIGIEAARQAARSEHIEQPSKLDALPSCSTKTSSRSCSPLNTYQNFCILRSCSHLVRFIDSPPDTGRNRTTRVLPNPGATDSVTWRY
jgi:hypothetical protein